MLAREVNDRFLVNEHRDLSFFGHILSLVIIFFLYKEYGQIPIAEKLIITGNVKKHVYLVDLVRNYEVFLVDYFSFAVTATYSFCSIF